MTRVPPKDRRSGGTICPEGGVLERVEEGFGRERAGGGGESDRGDEDEGGRPEEPDEVQFETPIVTR